jgi:hypothetical protein
LVNCSCVNKQHKLPLMQTSPTITGLVKYTNFINIQLTSFMDDLAIFFNNHEDSICGTNSIRSFSSIVRIHADITKSAYICINSPSNEPIFVENFAIAHAKPQTKHQLQEAFFSQPLGTRESLRRAKTKIKELCYLLKSRTYRPPTPQVYPEFRSNGLCCISILVLPLNYKRPLLIKY